MNFAQPLSGLFVSMYKKINRTGILNNGWAQSAFILSYFAYKKYLEDPIEKLTKNYPFLFQNGHIIDIGANIGYTSYIFSKMINPPYQIFAFEPEKRNIKILKKAAKKLGFSDNLIITEAAVGEKEGEIEIWQNDDHHADHRILTDEFRKKFTGNIHTQTIPLKSIDGFLTARNETQPIAFIKIDVQGYELPVCKGLEKTLASNPNCVIEFEYCPSIMHELGYAADELLQFFKNKNYFFYSIDRRGMLNSINVETDRIMSLGKNFQSYIDIICSKRNLI